MLHRLITSSLIGIVVGVLCMLIQIYSGRSAGDITFSLCAAQALFTGAEPYSCDPAPWRDGQFATYPLTAALVVTPLAWLPLAVAAGFFIGISTGLLTYGLLQNGEYWRLLVLASFPAIHCIVYVNWSLLLLAAFYLPWLYPALAAKPHAGAPIGLHWFSWRRVAVALGIVGLSLAIHPSWPVEWLRTLGTYNGGPALLMLPFGPLLALAALRWRDKQARYLLYCALVPLRPFYDYLILFCIPSSRTQLMVLVALSWMVNFMLELLRVNWAVPLLFLPCLAIVFGFKRAAASPLHASDSPQQRA